MSYLAGSTREEVSFLGFTPQGTLLVTGATDSTDFPVTAGSLQTLYAGPAAEFYSSTASSVGGDFFAAQIDPATGTLQASTHFGGPNADHVGETALGADGSVYFLPKWLVPSTAAMPVTRGALLDECAADCGNGYAARISPALDKLLYGTYLPGRVQATAKGVNAGINSGEAGGAVPRNAGSPLLRVGAGQRVHDARQRVEKTHGRVGITRHENLADAERGKHDGLRRHGQAGTPA